MLSLDLQDGFALYMGKLRVLPTATCAFYGFAFC